ITELGHDTRSSRLPGDVPEGGVLRPRSAGIGLAHEARSATKAAMTTGTHQRYPGVAPFQDQELARKVFFGRDREARVLADQIIANRLVVVYAKSGLGKTSLL